LRRCRGPARAGAGGGRGRRGLRARRELSGRGRSARSRAEPGSGGEGDGAPREPAALPFPRSVEGGARFPRRAGRPRGASAAARIERTGAHRGRADRARVGSMSALRSLFLAAADSPRPQRFVQRYGFRLGAARFVAGETLDEAVTVLRRLNDNGLLTNTTLLGEGVRD